MKSQASISIRWDTFKGKVRDLGSISREGFSILLLCARRGRWDLSADCVQLLGKLCLLYALGLLLCLLPFALLAVVILPVWLTHRPPWMYPTTAASCALGMLSAHYAKTAGAFLRHLVQRNHAQGPPRAAQYLLFLVPPKYRENLAGDLKEEYLTLLSSYGRRWADGWYWWQVIAAFGHFLLRLLTGLAAVWRLIR